MITTFDKSNLSTIRKDLNALVEAYGKTIGVDFDFGNISFSAGEFKVKMGAKIKGAITRTDTILASLMKSHSLKTEGRDGRVLTGYNSKAYAYPFKYSQGGKNFKCSLESAKMYFTI